MGFYLEMRRLPEGGEYAETAIPGVFWALWAFAGFALLCMGLAAHALLGDLVRRGSAWDAAIVWAIVACVPIHLAIGLKLAGVRRFVRFTGDELSVGFRAFGRPLFVRRLPRASIARIELVNRKPAANVATRVHDDAQYHIRGHWRAIATLTDGRRVTLDRHVEKGALAGLYRDLAAWNGQRQLV